MLCYRLILVMSLLTLPASAQQFSGSASFACYQNALARSQDLNHCDQAITETDLNTSEMAASYSNRAIVHSSKGDYQAALADHLQATQLQPNNSQILINRANTYYQLELYSNALTDLDIAVGLGGNALGIAHFNRSIIHARIGNKGFARQDATRAVALMPRSKVYQEWLDSLITPSDQNTPAIR